MKREKMGRRQERMKKVVIRKHRGIKLLQMWREGEFFQGVQERVEEKISVSPRWTYEEELSNTCKRGTCCESLHPE